MSFRQALFSSLEWRIYAFLITSAVLLINGAPVFQATLISLEMHVLLTIGHAFWYYSKHHGLRISLARFFPHAH